MKEMTIEQLVLSMFRATTLPPTKEEYNILGISKFNIIKRKYFRNVYGTLILYLTKLSLPGTFPEHDSELLETFNKSFYIAYKDNKYALKRMEDRLKKFEELTEMKNKEPFLDLALYITEMFEQSPKKLVYAARLNNRINALFLNYLTLGNEIKIIK